MKKRLDLQGVRALAVLLVALNHANVPFLKGGYIGVDVFFVLSGYFITGLLLREGFGEPGKPGGVSVIRFYGRRVRRIIPAACLTLAVTSIAVYVVYDLMRADYLQTKPTLLDAISACFFFANIHLAADATNYFAAAAQSLPSPVQHFWSLSVEEQFYLVWPSLLALVFLGCRRWARGIERRIATITIAILIVVGCGFSLWWSIHDTAINPQAAYFSTFARAWELGCGAGVALLLPHLTRLGSPIRVVLGWAGLAMIAIAAVSFSSSTAFPGSAALLPVLGSAFIVIAGAGAGEERFGVSRILAVRPMTYVGDRSYTFYLWHYPALIIVWQAEGRELSVGVNLLLLAGAFLISIVTYRLYENPLRFARWLRGWRTAAMVPVMLSGAVAATLIPILAFEASLADLAAASTVAHVATLKPAAEQPDPTNFWDSTPIPAVQAAVEAGKLKQPLPKALTPSLEQLEQENSYITYDIPQGCQPAFDVGVSNNICPLGDSSSSKIVVVFGDSHAQMWMPALIQVAKQQGFAVVPMVKAGCFVDRAVDPSANTYCGQWVRWVLPQIAKLKPVATIVSFQLGVALMDHPKQSVPYFHEAMEEVPNPVLLAPTPQQKQQTPVCVSKPKATMAKCRSHTREHFVWTTEDLGRMVAADHYAAIPTLQWFCADELCPMVINHTLVTRDGDHLTMEYSAELAPLLGLELKPILARLEAHPEPPPTPPSTTPSTATSTATTPSGTSTTPSTTTATTTTSSTTTTGS